MRKRQLYFFMSIKLSSIDFFVRKLIWCDYSTVWTYDEMTAKNIHCSFTYSSQHNSERPPEYMNSASFESCIGNA
jgi:hypothetical protein